MQGVPAEHGLLGDQGRAVVAHPPQHEAVVLEQHGLGERAREARHRQHLGGGEDERLGGVARVGHDVDAHGGAGRADRAAPGRVARVLLDERALEGAAHRGDGAGEGGRLAHAARPGRMKARATIAALRGRETTARPRWAP